MSLPDVLLLILASYLGLGLLFSIPFLIVGVGKIDPTASKGSWGFRIMILPGSIALWPLLISRWIRGINPPPEEKTAHRLLAKRSTESGKTR